MTTAQLSNELQLKEIAEITKAEKLAKAFNSSKAFDTEVGSVVDSLILDLSTTITLKAPAYFNHHNVVKGLGEQIITYLGNPEYSRQFAVATIAALFNAALTTKVKDATYSQVAIKLGQEIEQCHIIQSFMDQNSTVVDKAMQKILNTSMFGTQYALKQLKTFLTEKVGLTQINQWDELKPGKEWGVNDNTKYAKVGSWFITLAITQFPEWFAVENIQDEGEKYAITYVVGGEQLIDKVQVVADATIAKAFIKMPSVEPCPAWTTNTDGGFELNGKALKLPLMLKTTEGKVGDAGTLATQMVNNAQSVAWKVNSKVVEVANALVADGISLGKLIVPNDSMTTIQKMEAVSKGGAMVASLNAANMLVTHEAVYMPHCVDWRGRVYQYNNLLNVQSTDFGKALLLFAQGATVTPVAATNLAAHLANVFGNKKDKLPKAEKVSWVKGQHKLITKVATNPVAYAMALANGSEKETPDDPWQFIAACIEYHACVIAKTSTTTTLPVAVDATCSGIQIISAMMMDEVGAGFVNLLPSKLPQDIYQHCADIAPDYLKQVNEKFEQSKQLKPSQLKALAKVLKGKYARKLAKVVVMTVPYNAQAKTQLADMLDKAEELGVELSWWEGFVLVLALREALFASVGALKVMQQIGNQMKSISKANEQATFTWTSPSGVKVVQQKVQGQMERVQVAGKDVALRVNKAECDPSGHMTATCPNLVHSLDAALLHLTFAECSVPFGLIHDSVLALATDIDDVVVSLKQTFINMFSEDVLGMFAKEVGIDLTKLQAKGNLDLSKVMDSEYFFS